jgi:hypothetical protein
MKDRSRGNGHKHTTETPDVSHIRNVEVTHEESDVSVSGVLTFVVALTILTAAVYVGMLFLFNYFQAQEAKEPQPGPMALVKDERLPPEPRLQAAKGFKVTLESGEEINLERTQPQAEYRVLLDQWQKDLREGSKDSSGKPLGMPIDEAMKTIVGMDLPARIKGNQKPEEFAVTVPTAASSGRMTEKRLQ